MQDLYADEILVRSLSVRVGGGGGGGGRGEGGMGGGGDGGRGGRRQGEHRPSMISHTRLQWSMLLGHAMKNIWCIKCRD